MTVAGFGGDWIDDGKVARVSDESGRDLASNNPYGDGYRRQWSREAPAAQNPPGGGPIDLAEAQRRMAEEARRYLARTGQPSMDPEQPGPAQQESTLPAYRTQAHAWEEPSQTWVNAANQDAENQLREWNRQQGRGTPPAENPNQWDYETMTPEQAAAAAAAAETWRQPSAPAQPSTYSQSYQNDQSQGYTAGMTLSPEQAAYFSQATAEESGVTAQQTQQAYDQAQALSAVHFPGTDFQGQFQSQYSPTGTGTYSGTTPQNPVAGHAHDSLAPLNRANPDGRTAGLNRSSAVRRSTRGPEPRRRARGGGSSAG
ncbi:hypothetical protein ACWFRQ_25865 [Streptomyces niveus]|uniref:hypothetical protein n=1 Tax=Streptomyces niveus TaxID=193462 RepID=UPI003425DB00